MNSSNFSSKADICYHYIPTTEPPIHVSLRCIPVHYHDEVLRQLPIMLEQGIIETTVHGWPLQCLSKKSDYALVTEHSMKELFRMHILSHCLMMYRTAWLSQIYSQHWTSNVGTGRYLFLQKIRKRLLFAQDQIWAIWILLHAIWVVRGKSFQRLRFARDCHLLLQEYIIIEEEESV